jgi:hypothetical protein
MKKLNVLLIIAMLAAALLAANPPGKLVRLEIINASGDTVYMKLEGRGTGAFYYLTVPKATTKTFTILVDSYKRTTWACGGVTTKGSLVMTGNVKLKFVQCGTFPVRIVWRDLDGDGAYTPGPITIGGVDFYELGWAPNFGEPTQEKVVYWLAYINWKWVKAYHVWDTAGNWNSFSIWYRYHYTFSYWGSTKFPRGIYMRYKY